MKARFGVLIVHFPFAFSPNSISRRIASDLAGSSAWLPAHASILSVIASGKRNVTVGILPVAGRPRFSCLTEIDFFIFVSYTKNKPEGSVTFRPALTCNMKVST
jgi:hypothetical protein